VPTAGLLAVYLGSWMTMRLSGVMDLQAMNLWMANG
jgi:hypothetical protein